MGEKGSVSGGVCWTLCLHRLNASSVSLTVRVMRWCGWLVDFRVVVDWVGLPAVRVCGCARVGRGVRLLVCRACLWCDQATRSATPVPRARPVA